MPKGLKNIQIAFVEDHITHYGGLYLLNSFCKKISLNEKDSIDNRSFKWPGG